ncbi:hypothetical protein TIFTF001_000881 [Ficus carica]|uniref:Uncharacterized protein n=1 Tax=Ficus carica TaxID=3494 RepID=A0AA87ZCX9_FICCA|nr:hypothetical protein TIFTF001_000881 [Ficus carica]
MGLYSPAPPPTDGEPGHAEKTYTLEIATRRSRSAMLRR